jgi:hypothetical protein
MVKRQTIGWPKDRLHDGQKTDYRMAKRQTTQDGQKTDYRTAKKTGYRMAERKRTKGQTSIYKTYT